MFACAGTAVMADVGLMTSHCVIAGSEVLSPDASFVTHRICAVVTPGRLEKKVVSKVGVSDRAVAHHRGGKIHFGSEVSGVLVS